MSPAGPRRSSASTSTADRVKRLEFALNDTGGVTPRRAAAWQAAAAAVAEEFAAGAATVAFGTLGDPNLYSTFSYLAQTVRDLVPEVTVETVAGITAMQDLASRAGISLAEGTEPVTLVPLNGGVGPLDQALARGGTVVGYKVGAAASPAPGILRERLQAAGRLDGAVIGARLGLPGELVASAAEVLPPTPAEPPAAPAEPPAPSPAPPPMDITDIPYLSTLIIPALRPPATGAALRPATAEQVNSNDGASVSLERQRWNIGVVRSAAGEQLSAGTAEETGAPHQAADPGKGRTSSGMGRAGPAKGVPAPAWGAPAPARGAWCSWGPGLAPRTC